MIKELEKQIEELQKELEENNYEEKSKYSNKDLIDIIKQKDKEIKQYKIQIELFSEEKSKLYEDNTKMFNDLDRFQKYIYELSQQNKKLSLQINQYTNNINNNNCKGNTLLYKKKEIKLKNSVNEVDDIKNQIDSKIEIENNYDDITQNNLVESNLNSSLKTSNNIKNNIEEDKKYNGLTDNELNENQNILKTYNDENKNSKIHNYYKVKNKKKIKCIDENKKDCLYFDYDSKEAEELSD